MSGNFDIRIGWDQPDEIFVAIFMRDGEEWFLDGTLVGAGATPGTALSDLYDVAHHLVVHGENFLGVINTEDRTWLAKLMDIGNDTEQIQERYIAMREAGVRL